MLFTPLLNHHIDIPHEKNINNREHMEYAQIYKL